jgi:DNA-binding GntR family transcriptional regulator
VRAIAAEYGVAVNTARRAVELLKEAGLVTVEPGWGVFRA